MARKTILVCDSCSKEVAEGKGAVMRINFTDARRGSKQGDLCDDCAGGVPGAAVAGGRGREGGSKAQVRHRLIQFFALSGRPARAYEDASEGGTTMDGWHSRS